MCELAVTLGRPLLFPTQCRYCGQLICLYANPDGGFAILDSLGKPWPKHNCWGVAQDAGRYSAIDISCSKDYRLPVPNDAQLHDNPGSRRVIGTVVSEDVSSKSGTSDVHIYDGLH